MTGPLEFLDADEVSRRMRPRDAVAAIEAFLRAGHGPGGAVPRTAVPTAHGEFLLMPAESTQAAGVKVVTVAPANGDRGLPRVQGVYLLFDATTLAPTAVIDGAALTTLRTPAVSFAAVRPALTRSTEPLRVVVFGAGPQAVGHLATLADVMEGVRAIEAVTWVVRDPASASPPACGGAESSVLSASDPAVADELATAGLVICATTAREALFDSAVLRDDAVVVAVGSHQPDAREVDAALVGRAQVVVEDVDAALREAGDIVLAIAEEAVTADQLVLLSDMVCGRVLPAGDRPVFFKSTGMAWEDLAVAQALTG